MSRAGRRPPRGTPKAAEGDERAPTPRRSGTPPGDRRWLLLLCLATLLLQGVFTGTRVLVSYRVLALGGDAGTIGLVTALFALAPIVVAIRAGRAVDGGRADAVLRGGIVLTALSVALIALSPGIPALCLANVLMGVGQVLVVVASQGTVPLLSGPRELDRNFAAWTLAISLGQTAGLPLVGLLARGDGAGTAIDTTPALLVLAALAAVAVLPVLAFRVRGGRSTPAPAEPRQSVGAMLRVPGLRAAMFSSLAVLTSIDLVSAYLPVLGERFGFGVLLVTMLLTARTTASVVSRLFLQALLRRVRRERLLVSATLCTVGPMVALPWSSHPWLMAVLLCVSGFFWGIGQPLTMSWVTGLVDPGSRAAALSVRMTGNRIGQVLVPLGAGGLASVAGVSAVFVLSGGLLAAATVLTWRSLRRSPASVSG